MAAFIRQIILFAFCIAALKAQTCSKQSMNFFHETKSYINCLGDKLETEFQNLLNSRNPMNFVKKKRAEIAKYFDDADNNCTPPPLEKDLVKFMELYDVPDIIKYKLTPLFQRLVWKAAKNSRLSQCVLEYIRRSFLQFLRRCTGANIPTKAKYTILKTESIDDDEEYEDNTKPVLNKFPVFTSDHNLTAAREYVELLIKAYLALSDCKDKAGKTSYKKVLRKLSAQAEGDICDCAGESYDSCKNTYNTQCVPTTECIAKIARDPDEALNLRIIQRKATYCANTVGGRKVKGLETDGLHLLRTFTLLKNMKGSEEYKKFGDFVESLIKAQFSGEFCNRCKLK